MKSKFYFLVVAQIGIVCSVFACPNIAGNYLFDTKNNACKVSGKRAPLPFIPIQEGAGIPENSVLEIHQNECKQLEFVTSSSKVTLDVGSSSWVDRKLPRDYDEDGCTGTGSDRLSWSSKGIVYRGKVSGTCPIEKSLKEKFTENTKVIWTFKNQKVTYTSDYGNYGILGPIPFRQSGKVTCEFVKIPEPVSGK